VFGVIEGGDGACHGDGAGVVSAGAAHKVVDDVRFGNGVAGPDACHAVHFGKGAQHKDVVPVHKIDGGAHIRVAGVVHVSFVDDDEDLLRDLRGKFLDLLVGQSGAGGVVGVADDDDLGLFGQCGKDAVQIEFLLLFGHRYLDRNGAVKHDHVPEIAEGGVAVGHLIAGIEINGADVPDDGGGAGGGVNVVLRKTVFFCQTFL